MSREQDVGACVECGGCGMYAGYGGVHVGGGYGVCVEYVGCVWGVERGEGRWRGCGGGGLCAQGRK